MTSIPNRKRKFDQYCTITWKRWEIGCLLVLLTNRKWHTGFPLVQKVVTSNDWYWTSYLSCATLRSHPSNRWPLVKTSFKRKCTKIAIIKGYQQHRKTKYFCQFISVYNIVVIVHCTDTDGPKLHLQAVYFLFDERLLSVFQNGDHFEHRL